MNGDNEILAEPSIIIGTLNRNRKMAELVKMNAISLKGMSEEQGYENITKEINGTKTMIIVGGRWLVM